MNNTWYLRYLINNGFTIKNRRALKKITGEKEYEKLSKLMNTPEKIISDKKHKISYSEIGLEYWQGKLNLKIKPTISGLQSEYNDYQIFEDNGINIKTIKETLQSHILTKEQRPQRLPEASLKHSSTMEKLYSPEFYTQSGINQDGYYKTTLLDKETQKPVEAFVRQIVDNKHSRGIPGVLENERWGIYLKDTDGKYVLFGDRSFTINRMDNSLTPGNMNAQMGPTHKYAGIGLRAHQIAIERMLQEGISKINILSTAEAFPFHYKAGFRAVKEYRPIPISEFNAIVEEINKTTGIPKDEILSILPKNGNDKYVKLNSKDLEKLRKKCYLENNRQIISGNTLMYLPKQNLDKWTEQIKSQPILLG